jgi:hypothetical protein
MCFGVMRYLGCPVFSGLGIHQGFADLRQFGVRGFFFLQGFLEWFDCALQSQVARERGERPIQRDLVMFHLVSVGDQCRIAQR